MLQLNYRFASMIRKKINKIFIIVIISGFTILYLYGCLKHSTLVNTSPFPESDQDKYIVFIKKVRESNFNYYGDGNRTPLYPFLQAIFYHTNQSDRQFFENAKIINIFLSLLYLGIIYFAIKRYFNKLEALTFITIAAFTLFIFKAPYVQPELTFYTLYFLSFLLFIRNLNNNKVGQSLLLGLLIGLSYLAKATTILGIYIFVLFQIFSSILIFFKKTNFIKIVNKTLLATLITLLSFLVLTYPCLHYNKIQYGKYFYNINTSIYIWHDSIAEAIEKTGIRLDSTNIFISKSTSTATLQNYLGRHSLYQILQREIYGFLKIILMLNYSYASSTFAFLILYSLLSIYFIALKFKEIKRIMVRYSKYILFCGLFFASHIIAFQWYALIDSGPRFILTLYLPILFCIFKTIKNLGNSKIIHIFTLIFLVITLKLYIFPILFTYFSGF